MDIYKFAETFEKLALTANPAQIQEIYSRVSKNNALGPFWQYKIVEENGKTVVVVSPSLDESLHNFTNAAVAQMVRELAPYGIEVRKG